MKATATICAPLMLSPAIRMCPSTGPVIVRELSVNRTSSRPPMTRSRASPISSSPISPTFRPRHSNNSATPTPTKAKTITPG